MVDAGNKARVYREHGNMQEPDVLSARTYNTKAAWSSMLTAAPPAPEDGREVVWTDEQCVQFMCVALRHVEYKRGTKGPTCDDIRFGVRAAMSAAQAGKGGAE